MKINIKYAGIAAVILLSLLITSCMQDAVGPISKTTTTIQINMSGALKGVHTPLADQMFNKKGGAQRMTKTLSADSDTLYPDEVRIILLDMTKFASWSEFYAKFESTGQYSFLDTVISKQLSAEGKDTFYVNRATLKGYTGSDYTYVGDYGFSLVDGKAENTFYLNPGPNYYMYAFRSAALDKTISLNDGYLMVRENVENTIQVGKPDLTGSYSGHWTASGDSVQHAIILDIYQTTDDSIKGVAIVQDASCYDTLFVGGKLYYSEDQVTASLVCAASGYSGSFYFFLEGTDLHGGWNLYPECQSFYYPSFLLTRLSTKPNLGKTK